MMSTHILRLALLGGLGPLLATSAVAQEGRYFYGGLSFGEARARIDQDRISDRLLALGLSTSQFTRDERASAYKLFGGYQFSPHLAVEGGFFDLGRVGFTATTAPAGTLTGRMKVQGFNLDLVGTWPLTARLSAIGRVGAQSARTQDSFEGTGAVGVVDTRPSEREVNAKFGAGLQYEFSRSVLLRAEAERYRINDAVGRRGDVDVFSVSLVFPFGRAPVAAPRAAVAPAYVEPAATPSVAPAAALAPAVVEPERRRVSFSAESLFGFDQADVTAEGRKALDQFAEQTKATTFEVIVVEGHTDRLGTAEYNQGLSARRAEAVKHYLVASGGFDARRIQVLGKGESEPLTKPQDCQSSKPTTQLIACLQPDRRVDIEVTGTQTQ